MKRGIRNKAGTTDDGGKAGRFGKTGKGARRLAKLAGALLLVALLVIVVYEVRRPDDDAAEIAGPPPVDVRVLAPGSYQAAHPFAPYYVVPRRRVTGPAQLTRAATNRFVTRPEAALDKGGQAGSPQIVRLQLQATDDEQLTLTGVSFDVVSDAKPLKGWFTAQPACSFEPVQRARVTLDRHRNRVRYVDAKGNGSSKLALALSRRKPTVLELQAAARAHRVAWTASLKIDRDGRTQRVKVDDDGEPFRVTSARSSRGYAPSFGATGISGYVRDRAWDGGRITGC
jgi:hypothetical protein